PLSMSHMAARQEVRALLEIIGFTPADGEELPI
ncbi:MAG TPA: ATPase, partial [Thalassospira sp.]|nr:ATPase [Thalassospira sp.]